MDPDRLLSEINAISRSTMDVPHVGNALRELAHKINQLDDWIQTGGRLPAKWKDRDVPRHDTD